MTLVIYSADAQRSVNHGEKLTCSSVAEVNEWVHREARRTLANLRELFSDHEAADTGSRGNSLPLRI